MLRVVLSTLLMALILAPQRAAAGPIWPEGAAGRLPGTAEPITIPFTRITGELTGSLFRGVEAQDFEDMYLIQILDPRDCGGKGFFASTDWMVTPGGANDFDTQLWLFDAAGRGLLGNDDVGPGNQQSFISFPATDVTFQPFPGAGLYYLAITGFNDDPVSPGGQIFNQASPFEISGPDGPGGGMPIVDWTATGSSAIGQYDILLHCVAPIPEPATGSILLLALFAGFRRRRLPAC